MPRRTTLQRDQDKEQRLRRSSRLKTDRNETDDALIESRSSDAAPNEDNVSLTLRSRGRKRHHEASNDGDSKNASISSTRKKKQTLTRVSTDPMASGRAAVAKQQPSEASPNVHNVTYTSTITPVSMLQARARTDEDDDDEDNLSTVGRSKVSLLGGHDLESRSSSTTSSTTSTVHENRKRVPDGVVDLYQPATSNRTGESKVGTCKQGNSVAKSLTTSYLSSYGHEYYQTLKDREHHNDGQDDDASCASSNHTYSTAASDDSVDISAITETPRSHASRATVASTLRSSATVPSIPYRPVLGTAPLAGELEVLPCQPHLSPKMRGILIDWLIELAEEYRFAPLTLHLAVALLDKSLACGAPDVHAISTDGYFVVQREMLQCVGCACMWIASKWEEVEPPCVVDFVYISDNSYTREQISDMELSVCTALEFRLFQVTPLHFLAEYLRASCACGDPCCCAADESAAAAAHGKNSLFKHMVMYLLELSLLPHELAPVPASLKAAAAVYVARVTLGIRSSREAATVDSPRGYWTKTLQHYTGYDLSDLEDTALTIHRYHHAAEESEFKSVFVKFCKESYNCVSLKTVPLESDLGF